MKLQLLSDLHLSHAPYQWVQAPGVDAVVIAGDFGPVYQLAEQIEDLLMQITVPVFLVLGNHDYYGGIAGPGHFMAAKIKEFFASFPNVHLLDNNCVRFKGHHIVGGTLWTDFNLYGTPDESMLAAYRGIPDFRAIGYRYEDELSVEQTRLILPSDMANLHQTARREFERYINQGQPTIVISHFLPSIRSIAPQFDTSKFRSLNPYFASNCEDLMKPNVKLFCHGHTHSSFDYQIGDTRVVCNPRGYGLKENPQFNPLLTIEV